MTIPLNVLMIEDDENDAILLALKLREGGYDPWLERVQTPEALRTALDKKMWDIVISDHNMPRFSAPEALRVVREAGLDVPFIIISGKIDERMAVESMRVGAHDYLSKDNLARLIPVIEREMREALYRRERRQTAAALREHEALFRTVVNAAADAIILTDRYGIIEVFNHAAERMFGYSAGEIIRTNVSILMPEPHASEHDNYLSQYVETGERQVNTKTLEMDAVRKDGTIFPIDLSVSESFIGEHRVFTAIIRDITERKRAEEEKLQYELERVEMQKERELIDLKERMIHTMTHELRTPLAIIHSSCEIIERYHDRMPVEKQLERIRTIMSTADYMVLLLNDALQFAQGNAGRLPFNPEPMNLEAFCGNVFEQTQMSSPKSLKFALDTSGDLDSVITDEKLLQSILYNLMSNAVKYTPEGGEVTLRAVGLPEEIVLEVTDTGRGIPAEDQPRIFEAFHRANNSREVDGTGLGLAIVKNAVEAHGGTISLCSTEGKGTSFTVRLPRL